MYSIRIKDGSSFSTSIALATSVSILFIGGTAYSGESDTHLDVDYSGRNPTLLQGLGPTRALSGDAERRMRELDEYMVDDWDNEGAPAVSLELSRRVRDFVDALPPGTPAPKPAPGPLGEVTMQWLQEDEIVSVELFGDGGAHIFYELAALGMDEYPVAPGAKAVDLAQRVAPLLQKMGGPKATSPAPGSPVLVAHRGDFLEISL